MGSAPGTTQPRRVQRYSVKSNDGWHAIERGHKPEEGEWNTPTACGYFVTAPWGFERGLKAVTCEDCRGK